MSLYNEMRPTRLSDVKGQDKLIKILKENLSSKGHLPNAMLFVGTRGTGKTSVAKIVAKQLNCERPLPDGSCCDACTTCLAIKSGNYIDVLELDAASNNGVDNIRGIIEQVQFKPVGNKKIIILDEVHMLSTGAFNALLKIMEEPPADVLFILCTTELHKIPATILSRCRKFQFESISDEMIKEKLRTVNTIYGLTADEGALTLVAKAAKGSMRDAESIYENFLDVEDRHVTEELVRDTLGYTDEDLVFAVLEGIVNGDPTISFQAVQETVSKGSSLLYLMEECFRVLMDIITVHMGGDISLFAGRDSYLAQMTEIAFALNTERLLEIADAFRKAYEQKGNNLELVFRSVIIGIICRQSVISDLTKKIEALELEVSGLKQHPAASIPSDSSDRDPMAGDSHSSVCKPSEIHSTNTSPDTLDRPDEVLLDDEIANDLAAHGFSYSGENPFDEPSQDDSKESSNTKASETAEECIFSDFARFFQF